MALRSAGSSVLTISVIVAQLCAGVVVGYGIETHLRFGYAAGKLGVEQQRIGDAPGEEAVDYHRGLVFEVDGRGVDIVQLRGFGIVHNVVDERDLDMYARFGFCVYDFGKARDERVLILAHGIEHIGNRYYRDQYDRRDYPF